MKCGLKNNINIQTDVLDEEAAAEFLNTMPDFVSESLLRAKLDCRHWQVVLSVDVDYPHKTTHMLTWANGAYAYVERKERIH